MAALFQPDGSARVIKPENGKRFTMKEIRVLLGGDAERLPTTNRQTVFGRFNDGKLTRLAMDKGE